MIGGVHHFALDNLESRRSSATLNDIGPAHRIARERPTGPGSRRGARLFLGFVEVRGRIRCGRATIWTRARPAPQQFQLAANCRRTPAPGRGHSDPPWAGYGGEGQGTRHRQARAAAASASFAKACRGMFARHRQADAFQHARRGHPSSTRAPFFSTRAMLGMGNFHPAGAIWAAAAASSRRGGAKHSGQGSRR